MSNVLCADVRACSSEGAFLVERARQHRDMRVKGTVELRQKVLDLKAKLQEDRERMQKEFEEQVCYHYIVIVGGRAALGSRLPSPQF